MKRLAITLIALLAPAVSGIAANTKTSVKVTGLTCAGMEDPVCVDEPRFGWRLESLGKGWYSLDETWVPDGVRELPSGSYSFTL